MNTSLPETFRPRGIKYRKVQLGIDFPSDFYDNLKAIDENFYLVWHRFMVNYEGIVMNDYSGPADNPRHAVCEFAGELCFGTPWPPRNPAPDNRWHLWRLNPYAGWVHVYVIESTEPDYLSKLTESLYVQDKITSKYGHKAYRQHREEIREALAEKDRELEGEKMTAWQTSNKEMLDKAKDNLTRGKVDPTNPIKETISSFPGQTHRSTLKRPLEDEDVLKPPGG